MPNPLSSPKLSDPRLSPTHATVLPILRSPSPSLKTQTQTPKLKLWHLKRDRSARRAALAISQILLGSSSHPAQRQPIHKNLNLNSLKSKLLKPKLARSIITHLKSTSTSSPPNVRKTRGICLNVSEESLLVQKFNLDPDSTTYTLASTLLSGPGEILGSLGESTGTLNALAGLTTAWIETSGVHEGLIPPPLDRLSLLVYWWGYEITLPPPTLLQLSKAHSISSNLLNFLSALVLAGGLPEMVPFIRYVSLFTDMEWSAIKREDRGDGVVLASTWVMPFAIIPRPWDFPFSPSLDLSPSVSK